MPGMEWKRSTRCEGQHCVEVSWSRSSRCESHQCVEIARGKTVRMRDSKNPNQPHLEFGPTAWREFLTTIGR